MTEVKSPCNVCNKIFLGHETKVVYPLCGHWSHLACAASPDCIRCVFAGVKTASVAAGEADSIMPHSTDGSGKAYTRFPLPGKGADKVAYEIDPRGWLITHTPSLKDIKAKKCTRAILEEAGLTLGMWKELGYKEADFQTL